LCAVILALCGTGSKKEKKILKRLGKSRYNILFVDGCHENYDLLKEYAVTEFCGGKVRKISGRVMHLMRGEVYEIDNKKIFAFGGGLSEDNELRLKGQTMVERGMPKRCRNAKRARESS